MDHFTNRRKVGEIENASGVGTVGKAKRGDIRGIDFDMEGAQVIKHWKCKTFG